MRSGFRRNNVFLLLSDDTKGCRGNNTAIFCFSYEFFLNTIFELIPCGCMLVKVRPKGNGMPFV